MLPAWEALSMLWPPPEAVLLLLQSWSRPPILPSSSPARPPFPPHQAHQGMSPTRGEPHQGMSPTRAAGSSSSMSTALSRALLGVEAGDSPRLTNSAKLSAVSIPEETLETLVIYSLRRVKVILKEIYFQSPVATCALTANLPGAHCLWTQYSTAQ